MFKALKGLGHIVVIAWLALSSFIPIYGVLNWGWKVSEIMFLFGVETVIITLFGLAMMMTARLPADQSGEGFIWALGNFAGFLGLATATGIGLVFLDIFFDIKPHALNFDWQTNLGLAVTTLLVSHFLAFLSLYILNGKFLRSKKDDAVFSFGGRVLFTGGFAVIGGQLTQGSGKLITGLVLLCLCKMIWDVGGYILRNFDVFHTQNPYPDHGSTADISEEDLRELRRKNYEGYE